MRARAYWAGASLSLFAFALGLGACGREVVKAKREQMALQESSSGFLAYRNHIYPEARRLCSRCHGVSQHPLHATSDPAEAYQETLPLLDRGVPENSLLVRQAGIAHGGCSDCNSASRDLFLKGVKLWLEAEVGIAPNPIPRVTASALIPTNLPATLEFELPGSPEIQLSVNVERLAGSEDGYLLRRLRVWNRSNHAVRIGGLRVSLSGEPPAPPLDWSTVAALVSPGERATSSSSPLIVLQAEGPGKDRVSISASLESGGSSGCRHLEKFAEVVLPIAGPGCPQNRTPSACCVTCHSGSATPAAVTAMDLDRRLSVESLCSRLLSRSSWLDALDSVLIQEPLGAANAHAGGVPGYLTPADARAWADWIKAEHASSTAEGEFPISQQNI